MKIIKGTLNAFSADGLIIWSVDQSRDHDEEKQYTLKSGDFLKIFKNASNGDVHWEGCLFLEKTNDPIQPLKPVGVDLKEWVEMFSAELPCEVTPALKPALA